MDLDELIAYFLFSRTAVFCELAYCLPVLLKMSSIPPDDDDLLSLLMHQQYLLLILSDMDR